MLLLVVGALSSGTTNTQTVAVGRDSQSLTQGVLQTEVEHNCFEVIASGRGVTTVATDNAVSIGNRQ
jgi:hypothetical protein